MRMRLMIQLEDCVSVAQMQQCHSMKYMFEHRLIQWKERGILIEAKV
jgi:hypothetical protein